MNSDLVQRVRHRLVEQPLAADALADAVRAEAAGIVDDAVLAAMHREVAAELRGAGPLEPLLATPDVTDVLVNGCDGVWVDRGHGLERAQLTFPDDSAVRRLAQRLATTAGVRLDDAKPFVDAVLPDGTRMHAVLRPVASHTTISLRVLARRRHDLGDLVAAGAASSQLARTLRMAVAHRLAFVITGGTGVGKTTLLGALLSCVPPDERILLIEDARELVLRHPHVVRLATRAANVEDAGEIGLRDLVRQALRMRPDRLVVGEFRGAEMVELLVALNTGHEGGAATLHANSAADVPARFLALGALAGLEPTAMRSLVSSAIDLIVHLRRVEGRRQVVELAVLDSVVSSGADQLRVRPVWSMFDGELGGAPRLRELLGGYSEPLA